MLCGLWTPPLQALQTTGDTGDSEFTAGIAHHSRREHIKAHHPSPHRSSVFHPQFPAGTLTTPGADHLLSWEDLEDLTRELGCSLVVGLWRSSAIILERGPLAPGYTRRLRSLVLCPLLLQFAFSFDGDFPQMTQWTPPLSQRSPRTPTKTVKQNDQSLVGLPNPHQKSTDPSAPSLSIRHCSGGC